MAAFTAEIPVPKRSVDGHALVEEEDPRNLFERVVAGGVFVFDIGHRRGSELRPDAAQALWRGGLAALFAAARRDERDEHRRRTFKGGERLRREVDVDPVLVIAEIARRGCRVWTRDVSGDTNVTFCIFGRGKALNAHLHDLSAGGRLEDGEALVPVHGAQRFACKLLGGEERDLVGDGPRERGELVGAREVHAFKGGGLRGGQV